MSDDLHECLRHGAASAAVVAALWTNRRLTRVDTMAEPRSWQSETARLGNADPSHPTGWFERLWASAKDGDVTMPWDRDDPHPALASWTGKARVAPEEVGRQVPELGKCRRTC
jgi:hypothetical protein